jgi:hypothetical protein
MRTRATRAAAALPLLLLLGACSSPEGEGEAPRDDLASRVQAVVVDPERAERAVALIEGMVEESVAFSLSVARAQRELSTLGESYDSTAEQFEAVYEDVRAERRRHSERNIDRSLELREVVTDDEWGELVDVVVGSLDHTAGKELGS